MSDHRSDRPCFGGDECAVALDDARYVVLPVPYEATVSYGGGTAGGPEAILRASSQIELYDEQLRAEPWRAGIHTADPLPVAGLPPEAMVEALDAACGSILDAGKRLVVLGGEHSISPGCVAAAAKRHEGLVVVQLDAHADLRHEYDGSRWSHACAMARALECAPVRAVGIRNYSVEEARRIEGGIPGYHIVHAWEMDDPRWDDAILGDLREVPVYLTVDVDYFDPAIVPATGTPEPGGGAWYPTLRFLEELFGTANVVAADVVELAPIPGQHHADFTVARLVYKLIGLWQRSAPRSEP